MHRITSLALWLLLFLCVSTLGGMPSLKAGGHLRGGACCPDCGHKICQPEPITTKEKKHCWEIECKDICIPAIKWWWEPCCTPPKCGQVKTIKVLKKVEYECEKCGYKWKVIDVGDCDCQK